MFGNHFIDLRLETQTWYTRLENRRFAVVDRMWKRSLIINFFSMTNCIVPTLYKRKSCVSCGKIRGCLVNDHGYFIHVVALLQCSFSSWRSLLLNQVRLVLIFFNKHVRTIGYITILTVSQVCMTLYCSDIATLPLLL